MMNQAKKLALLGAFILLSISCGLGSQGSEVVENFATPRPALPTFTSTAPLMIAATDTPVPQATSIPTNTPAPPTDTPAPTNTPIPSPRASISKIINVRNGPGTNYSRIGKVTPGDASDILGRNADASWIFINHSGGQGWIFAELADIAGDVNSVPEKAADAPPPPPPPPPTNTPAPPPPPAEPAGPSYPFKLTNMFGEKNEGITQVRGHIKNADGQPLNGIRVRVRSGSFCTVSYPSGMVGSYPPGNFDILLDNHAKPGSWQVAIVDKPTNPDDNRCDPSAQQLSEEVTASTGAIEGVVYVEFKKQ
ncbi:MAG: hypothetical protein B6243_09590 [Anaerolineaceae bacterium 4572_5.2]|nr:MAG: hypothetical protein B6243_09590 [Anaerolineaceae bacterium 4572_5.2]